MQKSLIILIVTIVSQAVLAGGGEGGHGGGHHGIPWVTIICQAINVTILFGGLFFLTRKSVKDYFISRQDSFTKAANKAQATRMAAEQENAELKTKLEKLESSADESVMRARAEAAQMKENLINEAKLMSAKLAEEAKNAAANEIERARLRLRDQLIRDSLSTARAALDKVTSEDQQRLQGDFINNLQAVKR